MVFAMPLGLICSAKAASSNTWMRHHQKISLLAAHPPTLLLAPAIGLKTEEFFRLQNQPTFIWFTAQNKFKFLIKNHY